jgi:hypothetical protein
MPFSYRLRFEGRVVHVTGVGEGSVATGASTSAAFRSDPGLRPPFGLLVDVRALSNLPSVAEARSLVELSRSQEEPMERCAVLLVRPGVQYGMARMIQILSEMRGAVIRILTDETEALRWLRDDLGLVAETPEP